jgi:hypothetical protein
MLTVCNLGETATYAKRRLLFLAVGGTEGRDGTAFIRQWQAKGACASWLPSARYKESLSRYGVTEVPPNHGRRQWVWSKDEVAGMEPVTDERPGPHVVTIDQHGGIICSCMAGNCKAPTCKHQDSTLALLDAGLFQTPPQGA